MLPGLRTYGGWAPGTEPIHHTGRLRRFTDLDDATGVQDRRADRDPPYVLDEPDGSLRALYPADDLSVFGGPLLAEVDGAGIPVPVERLEEVLDDDAELDVRVTIRRRDLATTAIAEDP